MQERERGYMDNEVLYKEVKDRVLCNLSLIKEISDDEVLDYIDKVIEECGDKHFLTVDNRHQIRNRVFNSIRRLDVIQELIDNPAITEIMVNGANHIFYEEQGSLRCWDKCFESEERLGDVIQQIVAKANRVVNEANPIVDARLSDGSRVNVVLSPVSMDGSTLTIRKFGEHNITIEKLVQCGSITREVADFLEKLVQAKYNIFISGGTGTGKTTFLNALSSFIPADERIITIEDSAELKLKHQPNLVRMEARNDNIEGKHGVSIRDLIKTSLRMRPDRIIVGEVRDAAAIDMLTALNTGHDGSLSTGHANSPADMLSRLETMVLLGTEIPLLAVRKQIASALDIIIHLGRLRDKSRRVLEIVEVLEVENQEIKLQSLYQFKEEGLNMEGRILGGLMATGNTLKNKYKLERAGLLYEDAGLYKA